MAKEESCASKASSAFSTPRPSSVATPKGSVVGTPRVAPVPRKYVSPMAKAREEKKRRGAEGKEWLGLSDMESSSNPSSGSVASDASSALPGPDLPKFGEWEKHSANSGPCYTLLFQNAAQEKKAGGPIRVHAHRSDSPPRTQDLYKPLPATTAAKSHNKKKKKTPFTFLCCFSSSS